MARPATGAAAANRPAERSAGGAETVLTDYGATGCQAAAQGPAEHARRRQRRWIQAGAFAFALSVVVLLAASAERSVHPGRAGRWAQGLPIALEGEGAGEAGADEADAGEKTPAEDTYCAVFSDPSECQKQRDEGRLTYWSTAEVKSELWKTMKALAELELRENAMHKEHKAKAQTQADLFDLFRQTMSQEVHDIHKIQDEMHQKHTAAFKQLVVQLSDVAKDLRSYTDSQVQNVSSRIDALHDTHDFNHQRVLKQLTDKINLVNRKIEDLHRKSMTAVNSTQTYAEDVESAMKAGDIRLDEMIQRIELDFNALNGREKISWANLSDALQAAEEKQEIDRRILDAKIGADVGKLRVESGSALQAEKKDIRQQLARAMAVMAEGVTFLTKNTTARYDGIQDAVVKMLKKQATNNQEQDVQIANVRSTFEQDRDVAFLRLDAADARLDQAFSDLASAKERLEAEAAADYAFLQGKLDLGVALRDQEASTLRGWSKEETAALRAKLDTTQSTLDSERPRLQAQRDADILPTDLGFGRQRLAIWPAKIVKDVNDWDASVKMQLDADNAAIHATLTKRMQEAGLALDEMKGQMKTRDVSLQAQYTSMKELQDKNNALQQKAISDLERDSQLEKALSSARSAALDGNLTSIKSRLQAIKSEITRVMLGDHADIRAKVVKGFADAKSKLESDMSTEHTTLWKRINGGLGSITAKLDALRGVVEGREKRLIEFSDEINKDQRRQARSQNLEMDGIDREQHADKREIDAKTDLLLEALGTVKARLTTMLSHVSVERHHDDQEMRSSIETKNDALRHDHHLLELHEKLNAELKAIVGELNATLIAQKQHEEADFQDLISNLTRWDSTQRAENARQRSWLQSIADASKDAAGNIGSQTIKLARTLKATDTRLTASATKLEHDQRATANAMNTSLHADLESLRRAAFAFITKTRSGLRMKISGDMGDITARLNSLHSAAQGTQTDVQAATDAMRNKIKARQEAREAEIAGIVKSAAERKSSMDTKIDALLQRIEAGKANIGKQLTQKAAAERKTYAGNVKKFVHGYVESSEANTSAMLEQGETNLLRQLQDEVDTWSGDLKANKESSVLEAAAIDVKLRQLQATELGHRQVTNQKLVELLSAVDSTKDSADTAITTLRAGLQAQDLKLNQTVYTVTQDQQQDKERILSLIQDSLIELRANFSAAQAAQLQSMKGTMGQASGLVDKARENVMADMLRKEGILNQSLLDLQSEQEAVSDRHQAEYVKMRKEQEALKARLQSTINLVEGTVRLSTSKFENAQHRYSALQAQDFTDLEAKLDRAIVSLNTDSQDARTAQEKKILQAKTQLGQAKSALSQMHAALVRETASDSVAIKGEVQNRITALSEGVRSNIQAASTNLQTALNAQLANIASGIDTIKSKAASAEQELTNKMGQLEANEAAHDSAQAEKIKTLQAMQQRVQLRASKSAGDLSGNVSRIEALMSVGLAALDRDAETDKQAMLAQILDAVTRAKAVLEATVVKQQAVLQGAMQRSVADMDDALAQEKEAAASLQAELAQKIASLSQGDAASDGRWSNNVNTLADLIAKLRAGAHRNNTEVHDMMTFLMNRVSADQAVVASESTGDRDEFKKISSKDAEALEVNFTVQMAGEGAEVLTEFRNVGEHLEDRIRSHYQGPKDKEVDLRSKVGALASKITAAYNGRDAEIRAINSTSSQWHSVMAGKIQRFETAVRGVASAAANAKTHNFARLNRMRVHLQRLLAEGNALASLKAKIEALQSALESLSNTEREDYAQTDHGNGNIQGKIGMMRTDLEESLQRLRNLLGEETTRRAQDHIDTTGKLSAGEDRMGRIERDIYLLDKRRVASRGRAASSVAAARQEGPAPSAEPANMPEPESAPEHAVVPATAPAPPPAPEPEPETEEASPPAPAPNRPALAEGQTPMPEPIPWWEYRTVASGVDYQEGKIALKNGATSGYLRGVYPLALNGRWAIYAAMFAEQGDEDASIKVTFNGDLRGTFKNDPRSGFPCDGNKCISKTGRYFVQGTIEGGVIEYEFEFKATLSQRPSPAIGSRMWLGPGEAAFTGVEGDQPPLPSGGVKKTSINAINAIDGKNTAMGKRGHDGSDQRGYTMATEPRLTILLGDAVMWEGTMERGKAKVELAAPPDESYYSCVVTQAGMMALYTRYCHVSRERSARISLGLIPVMKPGEARIVLTWGAKPKDLDMYVLAPHHDPNQAPCEVNWRQKNCHSNTVQLDRDDTQGHGPETITVRQWNAGTYVVRIDEYRGNARNSMIGTSHATVAYYSPHTGGMFSTVESVGFVDGRVWYVMGIDGTTRAPFACTPALCPVRPQPRD